MTIHTIKSIPRFYEPLIKGQKTFEIRFNDRGYQVGDRLIIAEYLESVMRHTGRFSEWTVVYVTAFAQKEGWVVLGVERIPTPKPVMIDDPNDYL